jgi:hypothetical protein
MIRGNWTLLNVLLCTTCWAQGNNVLENHLLEKNIPFQSDSLSVYMICIGTTSKMPIVAKQFNYTDTNITHVGIGLLNNGRLVIYNMVNTNHAVALKQDSLSAFLPDKDIFYFSVWKTEATSDELIIIRDFIATKINANPRFDQVFDLENGDSLLYCSEFCSRALMAMNAEKYTFLPKRVTLNNALYETILQRKELVYIPVDFFQQSLFFKKIYEVHF